MTRSLDRSSRSAFTLLELLVSIAILAFLMVMVVQTMNAISKTWRDGERRVETFHNGRAVLDLIARDLEPAAISSAHQLIQNPFVTTQLTTLKVAANTDSLFWQAPLRSSASGDISEVGYYLTDSSGNGTGPYQIKRFFVPSTSAKFLIYTSVPTSTAAPWLATSTTLAFTSAEFDTASSVVSDGILGFWTRCLDINGTPIPWFNTNSPEYAAPSRVKFNSAARFQTAIANTLFPTPTPSPTPWPYTATTSPVTVQANRLPSAVEISLLTLDSRTVQRNPVFPPTPAVGSPETLPTTIATFLNSTLPTNRITSARLFTTTVKLANGTQ